MEKYGVACGCASGTPNLEGMEKLADGSRKCGNCGKTYKLDKIELKDQVELKDKPLTQK